MKTNFFVFAISLFGCLFFITETNAQNLLRNGTFDHVNPQGPISSFTRTLPNVGGG